LEAILSTKAQPKCNPDVTLSARSGELTEGIVGGAHVDFASLPSKHVSSERLGIFATGGERSFAARRSNGRETQETDSAVEIELPRQHRNWSAIPIKIVEPCKI